ncbi:hypothetical protein RJ640_027826 [Escallonia rubra]|uniref:Transcriptional factor DELLA N-terminal domain-containing protein n=1 Tax=Escallonia rubra TaxID=112253 RepID=A0AA88UNE9_9ASTE|nr:hypothetical protein RJ640_027826 [Escallonia rubra]
MCQNCFSASSSAASSSTKIRRSMISADMIDGLLAGAGYRVLSSELWQVARCLETVMVNAPTEVSHLANDAIHYNLSDVASWVDSLFSKLYQPKKLYPTRQPSQI